MSNNFNILDVPNSQEIAHKRIHDGVSFECGHYDAAVGTGTAATMTMLVATGSKSMHMIFNPSVGADATFQITNGVSVTTTGTSLSIFNKNANSTNPSLSSIYHTPVTSGGTAGPTIFIPGGNAGQTPGSQGSTYDREKILAPNTNYLLTMTNVAVSAQQMSLLLEWYEP